MRRSNGRKNINICKHLDTCIIAGERCNIDSIKDCDEFNRREELLKKPCPILQKSGYKDADCDAPLIRYLAPKNGECHLNGECIRTHSNKIQYLFGKQLTGKKLNQKELKCIHIIIKNTYALKTVISANI